MRWFWLTALLTTFFWLRTVPIFTQPSDRWFWWILLALVTAGFGLRKAAVERVDARWLVLVVPLAASLGWVPFPFHLPVILLGLGLVLLATVRFSSTLAWVGLPLALVGLILSVQAAVFPFLYVVSSRIHEIPWLTPLFYALARPFDPLVSLSEHKIIIPYVYDVFEFPTRLESLGFIPLGLMAASGLTILVLQRRRARTLAGFLGILVGYAILRYLVLIFLAVKFKTSGMFWLPVPMVLGYIPLVGALVAIEGFNRVAGTPTLRLSWPGNARTSAAFALVAAGVVGFLGLFHYHDAGVRKEGRLLIEELHSDWEWTTREYDTQWYGRKSGYNYYCLAQYLNHFYHVDSRADSLLPELLSRYDIVMLKTPTSPYSDREMNALAEFVLEGGGLWLHGDHTNVFGTSTFLNRLSERFGIRFRYDSTYDLRTMALSLYERPPIFAHPTVANVPPYLFATSCSMEMPFFSENMILGYGLKAMYLDYSQTSFFPRKENKTYSYGVFVQQGGVKCGKGRLAGYTDSTCFSNFFMFVPGKPELALATVEWLNRRNRFAWVNSLLLVLGLAAFVGSGVVMRRWERLERTALSLGAGFLGLAIAVILYDGHVQRSYPLPEPHTDYVHVAFDSEHSRVTLPTRSLTRNPEISLHTFFVWTQRLGFYPSFEPTLEEALEKGDLVVIADPWVPFALEEIDALVTYLSQGGRLLFLVDPQNSSGAPRQILGSLGLRLVPVERKGEETAAAEPEAEGEPEVEDLHIVTPKGEKIARTARPGALEGGVSLLRLSNDQAVLVQTTIGTGRVFVFSDFSLFTDESMGHTGEQLDVTKRRISELEYWMLREIMGLPQPEPFWTKMTAIP